MILDELAIYSKRKLLIQISCERSNIIPVKHQEDILFTKVELISVGSSSLNSTHEIFE